MYDKNTLKEKIACPHCGWLPSEEITDELCNFMIDLQSGINGKIKILGGARCNVCNTKNKFCQHPSHETGTALDLKSPEELTIEEFAQECEFAGALKVDIDYKKNFIHVLVVEEVVNNDDW